MSKPRKTPASEAVDNRQAEVPEPAANRPPVRQRTRPVPGGVPHAPDGGGEPLPPEATTEPEGYSVGYGKPPLATRFKPGQSGNPKGRRKGVKGLRTMARETLTQKIMVRTASGEKRMSRMEAVLHKAIEKAMKGDPRMLTSVMTLYNDAVPEPASREVVDAQVEDLSVTDMEMLEELKAFLTSSEGGSK